MNIKITECKELKQHTINCILNDCMGKDKVNKILWYWNMSKTVDEFKQNVLSDNNLKMTQAYAEISKETEEHWYRVREMIGNKTFKTIADAGAVRVHTSNLDILIPNGIGDGEIRCKVFNKEESEKFNSNMMNFTGISLEGHIEICEYDCSNNIIAKAADGNYLVYNYEGIVVFVEF